MRSLSLLLAALLLLTVPDAQAQQSRKAPSKVDHALEAMITPAAAAKSAGPYDAATPLVETHVATKDGKIAVDFISTGDAEGLLSELTALGLEDGAVAGRMVSGWLPLLSIEALDGVSKLAYARPAYAITNVGATTSQGDVSMSTDVARTLTGADGSGVTIGVLSDSYDFLGGAAADIASGDLPAGGVTVLAEAGSSDEGRAMLQLVHDVVPGADLAFHTAVGGEAAFAGGILALAGAGSDVIVDDILYLAEPMFTDGVVADAVETVVAGGVPYFSAAGNNGRDGYESPFVPSGVVLPFGSLPPLTPFAPLFFGGEAHDFDPGPGVDIIQNFVLDTGGGISISHQWAQPYCSVQGVPGPADFDIYLVALDASGAPIGLIDGSVSVNDLCLFGGDPIEVAGFGWSGPPTEFGYMIVRFDDDDPAAELPPIMKSVRFETGVAGIEYFTGDGTVYGHMNAAGALSIGASAYFNAPPFDDPALINGFSSAGQTPIFFSPGGPLPTPEIRFKPDVVGPDGTNTTFFGFDVEPDGFPNFFGTSAAAPHVAALAGLLLQLDPGLTPADVYDVLEMTARDMDDPFTPGFDVGYDDGTGFGFVDALAAINELNTCDEDFRITDFDADGVPSGEFIEFTNTGADAALLSGCTVLIFDPFTEDVTLVSNPPPFLIPPGGTVTFTPAPGSIPDGPGAFGLFDLVSVAVGTDVTEVLGDQVAAVVYFNEDLLVGTFPVEPSKAGDDFVSAMRRLATESGSDLPTAHALDQNYPNPFNPSTEIRFALPEAAEVSLVVFDLLGRPVATLVNNTLDAGAHSITFDASQLPSGTYLYRLDAGAFTSIKRMTLVK